MQRETLSNASIHWRKQQHNKRMNKFTSKILIVFSKWSYAADSRPVFVPVMWIGVSCLIFTQLPCGSAVLGPFSHWSWRCRSRGRNTVGLATHRTPFLHHVSYHDFASMVWWGFCFFVSAFFWEMCFTNLFIYYFLFLINWDSCTFCSPGYSWFVGIGNLLLCIFDAPCHCYF